MKNPNDPIRKQTCYFPACSTVVPNINSVQLGNKINKVQFTHI